MKKTIRMLKSKWCAFYLSFSWVWGLVCPITEMPRVRIIVHHWRSVDWGGFDDDRIDDDRIQKDLLKGELADEATARGTLFCCSKTRTKLTWEAHRVGNRLFAEGWRGLRKNASLHYSRREPSKDTRTLVRHGSIVFHLPHLLQRLPFSNLDLRPSE